MSNDEIKKELVSLIKTKTKIKVETNSTLKDLNIDSLDILGLIVEVENKFSINFTDDEIMGLKSVNDIINHIIKEKK
ncbi:MAG: acyl carrier protein [Mycoplasmataceae bacterium]|nr:acyl carrier protein [Mycoplasmataceae bacterium]